jgi:sulfhydrogenase subunit beta (sulfur reductase)
VKAYSCPEGFEKDLFQTVAKVFKVYGPVRGKDNVCRLQAVSRWEEISPGALPLIPLKKAVLSPREILWNLQEGRYAMPEAPPPTALMGIPPCDLYGLAYLDRVFSDDPLYQRRRSKVFLIGTTCTPSDTCFCPPRSLTPPFDLFLAEGRIWVGSSWGETLLGALENSEEREGLPFPEEVCRGVGPSIPDNLEAIFLASAGRAVWREVGGRCLSCGGCSAVCPTCYCYDVVDEAGVDGRVVRLREWDNCFFRAHALVAGGHNFRPDRGTRLRFRFEHKFLGFGSLRRVSSCVGCGRCGLACPVKIGVSEVLSSLIGGEGS